MITPNLDSQSSLSLGTSLNQPQDPRMISTTSGTLNIQSLNPPPQPISMGNNNKQGQVSFPDNDPEEIDKPIDSEISDLEKKLKELKEKEEQLQKQKEEQAERERQRKEQEEKERKE